jgi:5,5'-dehydrodivanillate O-demethylase oxygenase subunit
MLSAAHNELLTHVGPGTKMGNLLRRYWHPVAAVAEFDERPTRPVRLMGEDLVLYKDKSGTFGLVERQCPHRRADLAYGFVEVCGLRCSYHGWLFDEKGRCLEQPYEDHVNPQARFRDKITIKAYPVEAKAGLLFAYLGPQPAPLLPNWEPFTFTNGFVQVVFSQVPCNWLQCQENSIDPVHFEWMHDNWGVRLSGADGPYAPKHLELEFKEFEHGLTYHRVREGQPPNNELWTVGRAALWPNIFFIGHFEYRVPIDDSNTLSVMWFFSRVPKEREPFVQQRILYWHAPVRDPQSGDWIASHVVNQDYVAWVGQGTIADRTQEHLGRSDRGVVMMRRRFLADIEAIERGEDPKGIVRDPEINRCISIPMIGRDLYINGLTLEQLQSSPALVPSTPDQFPFLAGQPEAVRDAYEAAMGFKLKEFRLGSFVNLGKNQQLKAGA